MARELSTANFSRELRRPRCEYEVRRFYSNGRAVVPGVERTFGAAAFFLDGLRIERAMLGRLLALKPEAA
jgi:hypothetical protein